MKTRPRISPLAPLLACAVFLSLFTFHPLLFSQDAMKDLEIKAAKKPKSDKWTFSLLPVGLQKNPQVDFTYMTEMTDAGRKLPVPSITNPTYYISHSMGQHDVGDAYGGTREIKYQFLEKQLNTALASNGYRVADPAHPATQLLMFFWGMHNRIEPMDTTDTGDTGDTTDDSGAIATTGDYSVDADQIMNLLSRAKTIGGTKFANEFARALSDQMEWGGGADPNSPGPLRNFSQRDENTEALVDAIFNECYYLVVTAYDVQDMEAVQRGERTVPRPLWITRITTGSRGVSFEQTLPIMINNGAYFFGRETAVPEIVRKRAYKNATVEIGEAQVVEYMPATTGTTKTSGTATPATSGTTTVQP